MARVVFETDIRARFNKGFDAVEMCIQGGPVQRRVASVVFVVEERSIVLRGRRDVCGQGLEDVV